MWLRYRQSHITFINDLLRSTQEMPLQLLKKLNVVTAARKPVVVRRAIVRLLSHGSTDLFAPGQIDSARLFFSALVEDVGIGPIGHGANRNSRLRFTRWLDPIDPLSIAEDPECKYLAKLQEAIDQ
jgi:hypothetical protein